MGEHQKSFEGRIHEAAEKAALGLVEKGHWIETDYRNRVSLGADYMSDVFNSLDHTRIRRLVGAGIEEKIAEKILHAMATEIATDVKAVVCNRALREDLRFTIREKIKAASVAVVEEATTDA